MAQAPASTEFMMFSSFCPESDIKGKSLNIFSWFDILNCFSFPFKKAT
jgi:hypothetical protein